ncbi:MAG: MBOAT family O-acyltransferase [Myxococcota bacterium]
MTFVQIEFVGLLAAVFGLYWLLPSRRGQNALLVVASAVFYGWVHPWFVGLLAASTLLDYTAVRVMAAVPAARGGALAVSLLGNLGLLGAFKYHNFFVNNVSAALGSVGLATDLSLWSLVLPVGISFYTFQTLSYTIDVYRGQLEARRNLLDYAVYVSFFPQLVAGPIERASNLLPQVERPRPFDGARIASGVGLAVWGAFKKICIADVIAPYVDKVFMLETPSIPLLVGGVVAFGVQIMADFSGYTDIARGVARMLGFELSINFHRPFFATSTPDFWRRWHISLGTWIGDYVFSPLSHRLGPGPSQLATAILITFTLIGLWHGASWNFVLLGVWYGGWMVVYTFAAPLVPSRWFEGTSRPFVQGVAIALHSSLVLIPAGLLFREPRLDRLYAVTQPVAWSFSGDELLMGWIVMGIAGMLATPMVLAVVFEDVVWPRLKAVSWQLPLQTSTAAAQLVTILLFYRDTSRDFIYFQF